MQDAFCLPTDEHEYVGIDLVKVYFHVADQGVSIEVRTLIIRKQWSLANC